MKKNSPTKRSRRDSAERERSYVRRRRVRRRSNQPVLPEPASATTKKTKHNMSNTTIESPTHTAIVAKTVEPGLPPGPLESQPNSLPLHAIDIRTIRHLHAGINHKGRIVLQDALMIGALLNRQKRALRHGEWLKFLNESLPFDERTARRYMRLDRDRDVIFKSDNVSDLDLSRAYRILSPPKLGTKARTPIHDAAGGINSTPTVDRADAGLVLDATTEMGGERSSLSDITSAADATMSRGPVATRPTAVREVAGEPETSASAMEARIPPERPADSQRPATESEATPLFSLLDGVIGDDMWQRGWIRPESVRNALRALDQSSASEEDWSADELLAAKLHHQKLLVQVSSVINQISTDFPTDLMFDNLDDTITTITNWIRQEKFHTVTTNESDTTTLSHIIEPLPQALQTLTEHPHDEIEPVSKLIADFWPYPAVIAPNNFVHKSLSNWAYNIAVGCVHGCRFCSVPSTATIKQGPRLAKFGVDDPDADWGNYVFLRRWDEEEFRKSLRAADKMPLDQLKPDGNRAVIYCSTTDPYQVLPHPDPEKRRELAETARTLIRRSLELIRDESTLNVRILTRSPLARRDFDLFRSFGSRLVFGMSLPTTRNDLSKIYEPKAPAPTQRLATLKAAKEAGLHVYVAIAPTYPECDEADLRQTLTAIRDLDPITIFHEPINIRAENVERIKRTAANLGVGLNTAVFATRETWQDYVLNSLRTVSNLAEELGLASRLHLWPDQSLGTLPVVKRMPKPAEYTRWLQDCWNRVSEWPKAA